MAGEKDSAQGDAALGKFGDEFNSKLDSIFRGVEDVKKEAKQTKQELGELKTKVDKVSTAPKATKAKDNDYSSIFLTDEDKSSEKIKELESEVQSIKQSSVEAQKNAQYQTECNRWDQKAVTEVPLLKDPKFKEEVQRKLSEFTPIGKDAQGNPLFEPKALYDASITIENKWLKENREGTMEKYESLNVGNFGTSRRVQGKEVNEVQIEITRRLGLGDEKRAREIYEPWNKGKKTVRQGFAKQVTVR